MDLSVAKNTEHKKTDPADSSLLLGGRLNLGKAMHLCKLRDCFSAKWPHDAIRERLRSA